MDIMFGITLIVFWAMSMGILWRIAEKYLTKTVTVPVTEFVERESEDTRNRMIQMAAEIGKLESERDQLAADLGQAQKNYKAGLQGQRNAIKGQSSEKLWPFLQTDLLAADMRFLGSPIDYVIFNGLSDHEGEVSVVFVEIKDAKFTRLTPAQVRIKEAVQAGRVEWRTVNIKQQQERV